MERQYVEWRDESFYLAGSRVPLAHIVRPFQDGGSPESIRWNYPSLTLEQVYGALTYYLAHKAEVEADADAREREEEEFSRTHPVPPEIRAIFDRMRQQMLARRA